MLSTPTGRLKAHVAVVFFGFGVLMAAWAPHIPWMGDRHGLDEAQIGLLLLTLGAGSIGAMSGAGRLSARYGAERVTRVGAVVFAAAVPTFVAAPSGWAVFAAAAVLGAGIGTTDVAMNAVGVDVEQRNARPSMSFFHGGFSAGALAGAGLTYAALQSGLTPVQHAAATALAVLAGWAFSLAALPRDESDDGPAGHAARAAGPKRGLAERMRRMSFTLVILAAVSAVVLAAEGTVFDWSAKLLRDELGTTSSMAAFGFGAFSVTMAIGRFSGDWLNARVGPTALLRWGGALAALGLGVAVGTGSLWGALVGYAVMGLGLANTVPVLFTAGAKLGRTAAEGVGAVATAGYGGFLVAPPIVGFIARETSLPLALGGVAVVLVVVPLAAGAVSRAERVSTRSSAAA